MAEEVGLEPTSPFRGTAFQAVLMAAIGLLQCYLPGKMLLILSIPFAMLLKTSAQYNMYG